MGHDAESADGVAALRQVRVGRSRRAVQEEAQAVTGSSQRTTTVERYWRISRDGKELVTVLAEGHLSALVRFGALAAGKYGTPNTKDYNAEWTVERVDEERS